MKSEDLAGAAASFRATLPVPDEAELRAKLQQPILHDLIRVLRLCASDEHPLTPAKKRACMFFFGGIANGEAHLEEMKRYDGLTPERREQIDSAWEQVIASMEGELQPRFQYLAILRQADRASGARTFDSAVVAFDAFAGTLAALDGRDESDTRDVVKDVHYALYAQPDDVAYCRDALAQRLPGWLLTTACDQPGFQFLQYHHGDTGAQLDINVGNHWFAITGGPSAGPYNGGGWRDQMLADLVTIAQGVAGSAVP